MLKRQQSAAVASRRSGGWRSVFPDDVQHDILESRIAVVAVRVPAAGAQINFHVAGARRVVADLNDRAAKIRPAFGAGEAGMKNADGLSVGGFELVAAQALMLPDGLEQTFGRRIIFVAQDIRRAAARRARRRKSCRPAETSRNCFCARRWRKVKPARRKF